MLPISSSDRVFVLTGAGVSAESGIPTFRGVGGLWNNYRIEEVASPVAWAHDPELVWKFYSSRREVAEPCRPNPAHIALAELEKKLGERFFLCTQNVDDLHEQAGSRRVHHMHGRLFQSRCDSCAREPFDDRGRYPTRADIPRCPCGGLIRPHICWFGEVPFEMERIFAELSRCTLFLCVGSSGAVYPAAGFVQEARVAGARTVYVGPEEPENVAVFETCHWGPAGTILPKLLDTTISGR